MPREGQREGSVEGSVDIIEILVEMRAAFGEVLDVTSAAKMDQDCAELRQDLARYGVDLSDPVAGRTVIGLVCVMNARGIDHYARGCHDVEEAFGVEFIDVSGLASKIVLDAWVQG